jgi:signal transduction histidine kinase
MWAVVAGSIITARQAAIERVHSEGRNLAIAFEDEATHILDGITRAMELVAERMRSERERFDLYAWSGAAPLLSWGNIQATIIGPDGKVLSSTVEPHPAPIDLTDREHFRVPRDDRLRGLFIGKPVVGRLWRQPIIPITRRIDAEDGTFLGVLVFMIGPGSLASLHKSMDLGAHDVVTLAGLDDIIRARFSRDSPDGTKGTGISIAGGTRPSVAPGNAEGSYTRASVVDGIGRLYNYRRVGTYPLVVTVGLDLEAALTAPRTYALMMVSMVGIATILLAGLAAYLVREIGRRTAHEIELAEERSKLQATNVELTESKQRAEAASTAKSLFLANMSHELRTPLNAIIGFSQMIRDQVLGPVVPARYSAYAKDIVDAGEHLLGLISGILDIAKIEAGKMALSDGRVRLSDIVDASLAALRAEWERKRQVLRVSVPDGVPEVRADGVKLTQILINLLSNAVKFTPEGGRISVAIEHRVDGDLVLSVTDSGIGMSDEEIGAALEPFVQIENTLTKTCAGTGLGLPLARRLAELHGGSLEISSSKGAGTTVRVRLPSERVLKTTAEPALEIA